jgi:sulfoxide reductase catalytic subunit YedY
MFIKRRKGWELPESQATPEHVFLNRRTLLAAGAVAGGALVSTAFPDHASAGAEHDPSRSLYPAKRNETYALDRDVTPESVNTRFNNFYEFGSGKNIYSAADALKIRPWTVKIDGMVEKPQEIAIDDLLKQMPLEERLYRHRCVEAWAMAVAWTGFPLRSLLDLAKPLGSAKYVRMETFLDRITAPGQRQFWHPWPYVEGLTIAEAANDLAFLVTGAYGKPLPKSMGAPLRLATPWKYGFKSIKSITRISLVEERPVSFWENLQAKEYGFWANVNPAVPHPRWSQASEEVIGTGSRQPTRIYNGYGEFVASLYVGLEHERLYV